MLDKKISISEQVSNLPLEGQLIFTWSIPHADDLGLLPISHKTLKAMIIPMMEMSLETFEFQVSKILEAGLWEIFEHNGNRFYRIVKFKDHQTLKKDRKPITYLDNITDWEQVEKLGFHLETIGNPREDKIREDKISKHSALGADIIKKFEDIDPKNKKHYANRTQRSSCDFLLQEYGLEKVFKVIEIIKENRSTKYFPSITSPYELQQKWTKVGEFLARENNNKHPNF